MRKLDWEKGIVMENPLVPFKPEIPGHCPDLRTKRVCAYLRRLMRKRDWEKGIVMENPLVPFRPEIPGQYPNSCIKRVRVHTSGDSCAS
jgi:hypothetical protein